jgi:hypothetical protein
MIGINFMIIRLVPSKVGISGEQHVQPLREATAMQCSPEGKVKIQASGRVHAGLAFIFAV